MNPEAGIMVWGMAKKAKKIEQKEAYQFSVLWLIHHTSGRTGVPVSFTRG